MNFLIIDFPRTPTHALAPHETYRTLCILVEKMIKVNARLLPKKSNSIDNISIDIYNKITEGICNKLNGSLKDKSCKIHPTHNNIIDIISVIDQSPKIIKRDFCCEDFSNSIKIELS